MIGDWRRTEPEGPFADAPICVYTLLSGGNVVYVGVTCSVARRAREHALGIAGTRRKIFDEVSYAPLGCSRDEAEDAEKYLMWFYQAHYNRTRNDVLPPRPRCIRAAMRQGFIDTGAAEAYLTGPDSPMLCIENEAGREVVETVIGHAVNWSTDTRATIRSTAAALRGGESIGPNRRAISLTASQVSLS